MKDVQAPTNRKIDVQHFSTGYVTVPKEDVSLENGGFIAGFSNGGKDYSHYGNDPIDKGRIIYKEITVE